MRRAGKRARGAGGVGGKEEKEPSSLPFLPSFLPLLLFSPSSKKNNRDHTHNISRSSSRTVSLLHTFRGGQGCRENEKKERGREVVG